MAFCNLNRKRKYEINVQSNNISFTRECDIQTYIHGAQNEYLSVFFFPVNKYKYLKSNFLSLNIKVACERIILMMNNTGLVKERRLSSMNQVLTYLIGRHDDVGLSGDRGDLYRRKLAEQIFLAFAINGVDHNNVVVIVESAIQLEQETRRILMGSANTRFSAPGVRIDEQVLNILARIAEIF